MGDDRSDEYCALLDAVQSTSWLTPDKGMSNLEADAVTAIEAAHDEITTIFAEIAGMAADELPMGKRTVVRTIHEASRAWLDSCVDAHTTALKGESDPDFKWHTAHQAVLRLRMEAERASLLDFAAFMVDAIEILRKKGLPDVVLPLPGVFAVVRHMIAGKFITAQKKVVSPWKPLVDLWMRGAWPMLCANGDFIVYVPSSNDGRVVATPPTGEAAEVALKDRPAMKSSMLYMSECMPPGPIDVVYGASSKDGMEIVPLTPESQIRATPTEVRILQSPWSSSGQDAGAKITRLVDKHGYSISAQGTMNSGTSVNLRRGLESDGDLITEDTKVVPFAPISVFAGGDDNPRLKTMFWVGTNDPDWRRFAPRFK